MLKTNILVPLPRADNVSFFPFISGNTSSNYLIFHEKKVKKIVPMKVF